MSGTHARHTMAAQHAYSSPPPTPTAVSHGHTQPPGSFCKNLHDINSSLVTNASWNSIVMSAAKMPKSDKWLWRVVVKISHVTKVTLTLEATDYLKVPKLLKHSNTASGQNSQWHFSLKFLWFAGKPRHFHTYRSARKVLGMAGFLAKSTSLNAAKSVNKTNPKLTFITTAATVTLRERYYSLVPVLGKSEEYT